MKRFLIWLATLMSCGVSPASAAISVGPNGTGLWTFDTPPAATEWTTAALPGGSADIASVDQLDTAVLPLSAAMFSNALPPTATIPPSANGLARYNATGRFLQMRPAGVAATVLLATLQNDTGQALSVLTVSYDLGDANPPWVTVDEQVPGLRAYFSTSGTPASWQLIPESIFGAPGFVTTRLELGFWPAGAMLFMLWADENAIADANGAGSEEGAYLIDNFSAIPGNIIFDPIAGAAIDWPVSGQSGFAEGGSIPFSIRLTSGLGAVTNVVLFERANFVGQSGPPPLSSPINIVYMNAQPGLRRFSAAAFNSMGIAVTSAPVSITVVGFQPTLTISAAPGLFVVSWPDPSDGFELQSASNFSAPVWQKVLEPDAPADGFHHVTVDTSPGPRFFRLEKR